MSNSKQVQIERYNYEGDYKFTVPTGVTNVKVRHFKASGIRQCAGGDHVVLLSDDGKIWTWGGNEAGQLGSGTAISSANPYTYTTLESYRWKKVASNWVANVGLTYSGLLYAWGYPVGSGAVTPKVSVPTLVAVPAMVEVVDIEASSGGAFFIDTFKRGWAFGFNGGVSYGMLGVGSVAPYVSVPTLISGNYRWKRIVGGKAFSGTFSGGIAEDGNLYAWGMNSDGQLGINSINNSSTPVLVISAANTSIGDFSLGRNHMAFIFNMNGVEGSAIMAVGKNHTGQIGDGTVTSRSTPTLVVGLPLNKKWVQISCSDATTYALADDGELYGWGWNGGGKLPSVAQAAVSRPVLLNNPSNWNVKIRAINSGTDFGIAEDTDGKIWTFGSNNVGQLGDTTFNNGLTMPNFNVGPPGTPYYPRGMGLEFMHEEELAVMPGEVLNIKLRQYRSEVSKNSKVVSLRDGAQAVHIEYIGD